MLLKQYTDRTQRLPFTTILTELQTQQKEERREGREMALYQFITELERWDWKELSPEEVEELWDDINIWDDEG